MATNGPLLELEGAVSFPLAGAEAHHDPQVVVIRGEFLAVAGPSGAGKTRLLRLLAGIDQPSHGRLRVDGRELEPDGLVPGAQYVLQDAGLGFAAPTVAAEIALGATCTGMTAAEAGRVADGWMAAFGLSHLAGRDPGSLSEGEQQEVALAAALACRPELLLLDEATAHLDAPGRARVRAILDGERLRGMTLVTVSQEPDELAAADRLVVLDGGTIVWSGPPGDLVGDAARARAFGLRTSTPSGTAGERTPADAGDPGSPGLDESPMFPSGARS